MESTEYVIFRATRYNVGMAFGWSESFVDDIDYDIALYQSTDLHECFDENYQNIISPFILLDITSTLLSPWIDSLIEGSSASQVVLESLQGQTIESARATYQSIAEHHLLSSDPSSVQDTTFMCAYQVNYMCVCGERWACDCDVDIKLLGYVPLHEPLPIVAVTP